MDKFTNDLYSIFELINNNDESKTFMNIKTISKQYLAYYIYRIITKFMILYEDALSGSAIDEFLTLLRIPKVHDRMLNYPLSGKMTNDEQLLDMIVLMGAGEILEVGTHNELIKRKSSYFSLFNQQGTSMSS